MNKFRDEIEEAIFSVVEKDPWKYSLYRNRDVIADRFDEPVFFNIMEKHNRYLSRNELLDIIQDHKVQEQIDEILIELAGMEDYRRNPERYYGYPWV